VTTIKIPANGLRGRIISQGNLVSYVTASGGFSGVIAAGGDLGAIARDAAGNAIVDAQNRLSRFGGILVNGTSSGQIAFLGNTFGDITLKGSLTGRIAAQGRPVQGLDANRIGILGNLTTLKGSIDTTAAIVSGGVIGDAPNGTLLTAGTIKGIVAAKGDINFGQGNTSGASIFENAAGTSNGDVIDQVFQDDPGNPLTAIDELLSDLARLRVVNGQLSL
jgi:hypothetical protein